MFYMILLLSIVFGFFIFGLVCVCNPKKNSFKNNSDKTDKNKKVFPFNGKCCQVIRSKINENGEISFLYHVIFLDKKNNNFRRCLMKQEVKDFLKLRIGCYYTISDYEVISELEPITAKILD